MMTINSINNLLKTTIPDHLMSPKNIEDVLKLPTFLSSIHSLQELIDKDFDSVDISLQESLVLRRLTQLVEICRINPVWKERINNRISYDKVTTYETFMSIPITDKEVFTDLFTDQRVGMVVPIEKGGFQIASSGGTTSGRASEIVYSRKELLDTYKRAGDFIGKHIVSRYMDLKQACWVGTTLADSQLWSSGTMVGGLLQEIPNTNYLGIGAMSCDTYRRIMNNPGQKAFMGIVSDITSLVPYAQSLTIQQKQELRLALYGSGLLPQKVKEDLKQLYPNLLILSFFAATQAETIGLQLNEDSNILTAVPGLHLIEIVDDNGRWVKEGEEGDLVITRLFANEAPILRYKLGDRVIRRTNLKTNTLNSVQFEYVGRSDDFIVIANTKFYIPHALPIIARNLKNANIIDLYRQADLYQFQINENKNDVHLIIATSDAEFYTSACKDKQNEIAKAILSGFLKSTPNNDKKCFINNNCHCRISYVDLDSPSFRITTVGKIPLIYKLTES
ncbi:phenylacetate--CoA ligase family protein [Commensalibacter communis]|uniref:hypothetical protein n=1 Tax=Commensalibacter communis TaxID=2972786 RepID=UPI00232F1A6B|nr:hypothetical protein [Commensalibacter communis]